MLHMLVLAFSSKHRCAWVQSYRAASMTVEITVDEMVMCKVKGLQVWKVLKISISMGLQDYGYWDLGTV